MRPRDEIAERLAELMSRVSYLDDVTEARGPNHWRSRESDALGWAIDALGEMYPESVDAACQIAASRTQLRREREAQRGERY